MKQVWLSHKLTNDTPLYGGAGDLTIKRSSVIANGDSCNASYLQFSSHSGTHVDAPLHFIENGFGIDDYTPDTWFFNSIQICNLQVKPGQIIGRNEIKIKKDINTDLLLLRTSFERYRNSEIYWEENPGIDPEGADYLLGKCPNLKMVGMDFISISSYAHRQVGREAHKTFLSSNLRLIEDMHLETLEEKNTLSQVIVMPLRFSNAEGSPCTIVGILN